MGELAAAARRSQLISPLSISLRCERTFSQRCIHQCILRSPRRAHSSRCIHNQAGPGCYSSARRSTYRMIKACAGMRARLEDSAKGWCYLATAQHSDRVDLQVYRDAWHSELLSTEDNVHKELLTVYCGKCTDDEGGVTEKYTKHWRRAQLAVRTRTVWLHSMLQSTP